MQKIGDQWAKALISGNGFVLSTSNGDENGDTSSAYLFSAGSTHAFGGGPAAKAESAYLNEVSRAVLSLNL